MAIRFLLPAALLLGAAQPPSAPSAPPAPSPGAGRKGPADIVADAPASAWRTIPADRLLVMDLADGARVAIALDPQFAPVHVANIVALARAHWWDGAAITRVQDNYVTQWGDPDGTKPLPRQVVSKPPAEYDRAARGVAVRALPYRDSYAARVGHSAGWAVAGEGDRLWLPHCYGMVGVGRDMAPDTGTGSELYTVIGQAPRHLDRNIAMVGRVVAGMEALSARPRGTAELGMYAAPGQRTGIVRVRLASEMPAAGRPSYQLMDTDGPIFAAWVQARANRQDAFFVRPAGAVDICNLQPPVRPAR